MAYENAPATRLVATRCACCARPLVDAVSTETGVGPDCRKRHGYTEAQEEPDWEAVRDACRGLVTAEEVAGPGRTYAQAVAECMNPATEALWRLGGLETRRVANLLVHRIAAEQQGEGVQQLVKAVHALGYRKLAVRIAERLATVRIEYDGGEYLVHAPYSEEGVQAFRSLPQTKRRFDKAARRWRVHESARRQLFGALRRAYRGHVATGPKGLFTL